MYFRQVLGIIVFKNHKSVRRFTQVRNLQNYMHFVRQSLIFDEEKSVSIFTALLGVGSSANLLIGGKTGGIAAPLPL